MRHKLSPAKYRDLKKHVWERDGWCVNCGRTDMLSLSHVIRRSQGGGDYAENCVAHCIPCHQLYDAYQLIVPENKLEEIGFYNLKYDTKNRIQSIKDKP